MPRYKTVLEAGPVDYDDLEKIEMIRADFFSALPSIRATCERALLENLDGEHEAQYLLSGIAAADGLLNLAQLLNFGSGGRMCCTSCGWRYRHILFGERVAVYADDQAPSKQPRFGRDESRALLDAKDGAPSRYDGFVVPVRDSRVSDRRIIALLSLADRATDKQPAVLLRNFLGSFHCGKCGVQGPIQWR